MEKRSTKLFEEVKKLRNGANLSKIETPTMIWCRRPNPCRVVVSEEEEIILVINIVVPLVLIMYSTGKPYHYYLFIHATSLAHKKAHELFSTRSELSLLNHKTGVF